MLLGLCALILASALAFPACLCSHRMIDKAIGLPASISESIRAKSKESICPHKVLEDNEYIVANIQNLDGSPDYLYAAFDEGGYAFFFEGAVPQGHAERSLSIISAIPF